MPPKPPDDIRARIRSERLRLGLTVAETAERMGVSRQSYLQLETRTLDPKLSTIVSLVGGVGMRLSTIAPELFEAKRR